MRRFFRSMAVVMGASLRADPVRTVANLVMTILAQATFVVTALALKQLTNAVVAHDSGGITQAAVLLGALAFAGILTGLSNFNVMISLRENVAAYLDERLIELTTGVAGLEHHERPEYLDELEVLRTQRDQLAGAADAVTNNVAMVVQLVTTVGLLATVHPLLLVLPAFGIPSLVIAGWSEKRRQDVLDDTAEELRVSRHLFELATKAGPAKELRIFGLGEKVIDRHDGVWRAKDRRQNAVTLWTTFVAALGWVIFGVGFAGAMALVAVEFINGRTSIGAVVLTLTLAAQLNQQVSGLGGMVSWLVASLRVVGRYLWLVDYATDAREVIAQPVAAPDRLASGIDLHGVAFRYPGTDVDILTGVDLHIPAGATVAVVGDNGAGKTTLVKLLCRFYEPTAGRITVDGVDLTRIPVEEWRQRLAGGFQDFAKLELAAGETVGVGDLPHLDDGPALAGALERASAASVIDTLPSGLDTQLGRSFGDGVELSGGQWQKLALGRAMMRPAPLLLVLDEPTASLDAETEHALFERYAGAARRVASGTGAITVLVSHRFSTVRMADLIVVVAGGRVTEVGDHDTLVGTGGLYAELYELQARAYR